MTTMQNDGDANAFETINLLYGEKSDHATLATELGMSYPTLAV